MMNRGSLQLLLNRQFRPFNSSLSCKLNVTCANESQHESYQIHLNVAENGLFCSDC